MSRSKRMRIFAGPNGSGKSTLFQQFSKNYNAGYFVNADLLENQLRETGLIDLKAIGLKVEQIDLDEFSQSQLAKSILEKAHSENCPISIRIRNGYIVNLTKQTNSYEGAFTASFIRDMLFKQEQSFSFETVMSHPAKVEEMLLAREMGYKVYLYFVCIDDPEINISRVEQRVEKGGHPVEKHRIVDRYVKTLGNLYPAIQQANRAYLFDNSGYKQVLIAELSDGELELKVSSPPNWFYEYVLPHYT
jgi:predicted ABC-type ATPase